MLNFYDSDDMSPEAKAERRRRAKGLKWALILGLLVLLFQPIYMIITLKMKLIEVPLSGVLVLLLIMLWSWCIYKVYKIDFVRDEDKEDKGEDG